MHTSKAWAPKICNHIKTRYSWLMSLSQSHALTTRQHWCFMWPYNTIGKLRITKGSLLASFFPKSIVIHSFAQCRAPGRLSIQIHISRWDTMDMKPLQTLHEKRARGPLRFLIGNIKACLGNAPHPGTAASANYIEWLECLGSCCFEYEQGLTILCHWSLTSANALTTENIFACIRNRMGHEGHAANVR